MKYFIISLMMSLSFVSNGQLPVTLRVPPHEPGGSLVLAADISTLQIPADGNLQLWDKNSGIAIPFQLAGSKIYWKVTEENASQFLEYELRNASAYSDTESTQTRQKDGLLSVHSKNIPLLGYQMALMPAPDGADPSYSRSGFIHPLNTPSGKRLTRIQPKDHFHHYGIWNPWTHVEYNGDTLDFWNLNQKQGTVRFSNLIYTIDGPVFSEFQVLHEHVVLKGGKNEVALKETQTVRITPLDETSYLADFTFSYHCATPAPFTILEYRYAGFGWRTTEEWDNQNSTVLTSEGKNRKEADGSTARWCIVQGKLGNGKGGAVMLSHPQNFNHPEPLRIWPENQYGRGDMFANFAPTKNRNWNLEPGKNYTLKYRMLVFDGELTADKAEKAWRAFAKPIEIPVKN